MRNEKSDTQFVEWSSGIHPDDYDVSEVAAFLNKKNGEKLNGLDVGGGIGSYANALASRCNNSVAITVVDPGKLVQEKFLESDDLHLVSQDFLEFDTDSKFDFIILKTVLHHMIGADEQSTTANQIDVLKKAKSLLKEDGLIVVEENYFDGWFNSDLPARLIFFLTRQKLIEHLVRWLGANTAGEGVRFRSTLSWERIFRDLGLKTVHEQPSPTWGSGGNYLYWQLQRLLLMCTRKYQSIRILKKATEVEN